MKGVLIWDMPPASVLAHCAPDKKEPKTIHQRNDIAESVITNTIRQLNNVVIIADGRYFYILKDKILGYSGQHDREQLPVYIKELKDAQERS